MNTIVKTIFYTCGVLVAIAAVSLATGAPAQIVQILNGSTIVDSGNGLPVNVVAGGGAGAGGTFSSYDATFPDFGTAAGISDGTNMVSIFTPSNLLDGVTGTHMVAVGNYVFNGTTWDREHPQIYSYSRKTADGQVKASAGFVHTVCISPTTATPTAGLISVNDATTETTPLVYSTWVFATLGSYCATLDATFATGIYVSYDGSATNISVTVTYR